MSQLVEVVRAWETFSQSTRDELVLGIPQSEVQYDALIAFADELTSSYNCNDPEHAPLFDLVAYYIGEWEKVHEAEILAHEVPPHEMLAYYLEVRDITQRQLQRDGVVNQGNLSKILKGEREISKDLARKLARYFGVSVEVFI